MSEQEAQTLANAIWQGARDKGDLVSMCYRKLERRWMHYEKIGLSFERAKRFLRRKKR